MTERVNALYSIVFKITIAALIGFLLDSPEWVGRWEAQKDIAYDSVMSEYYADVDCDCTEAVE